MLNRLALIWRDSSGAAMFEFVICLPVLCLLYIVSYAVADVVSCSRKVTVATRTLTDLVSRSLSPSAIASNPSGTDATSLLSAAALTLTPYSADKATENVALVRVCDSSHAYVIWTQAVTFSGTTTSAATPILTAGSLSSQSVISLPTGMVTTPMIPTSPDGSDVCNNYSTSTSTTTQVGTSGSFIFLAEVDYTYAPLDSGTQLTAFGFPATVPLGTILYMTPRLT
jgi:Flp pilus assembly protein TadG